MTLCNETPEAPNSTGEADRAKKDWERTRERTSSLCWGSFGNRVLKGISTGTPRVVGTGIIIAVIGLVHGLSL
jgi:hypothetical protein